MEKWLIKKHFRTENGFVHLCIGIGQNEGKPCLVMTPDRTRADVFPFMLFLNVWIDINQKSLRHKKPRQCLLPQGRKFEK